MHIYEYLLYLKASIWRNEAFNPRKRFNFIIYNFFFKFMLLYFIMKIGMFLRSNNIIDLSIDGAIGNNLYAFCK